jgi:excisionase family DNA binding protein
MSSKPQLVMPVTRRKRTLPVSADWLSPKAAAERLGIGVSIVYAACAAGTLKHAKFGHSTIRIRPAWVDAWAESLSR